MSAFVALIASLAWGIGDFLGGTLSRRVSAIAVAGFSQVTGIAVVLLTILIAQPEAPGWASISLGSISGVTALLGAWFMYRAMTVGRLGVVAPIVSSCAVVPVLWGVCAGEPITALQAVGILSCLSGIVLVSLSPSPASASTPRSFKPIWLAIASALTFGIGIVILAHGSFESPVYSTLFSRFGSAVTATVIILCSRPSLRLGGRTFGVIAALGCIDAIGYLGFTYATSSGQLALAAVLSGLYPAVTALLAFCFLKERLTWLQILGVAITLTGVVLISL
ncbi:MAG: DMT family transporter [Propionibacteriaceae bacterium]|nr:DMT family transporter [Propionibacteriaceae bacterium]